MVQEIEVHWSYGQLLTFKKRTLWKMWKTEFDIPLKFVNLFFPSPLQTSPKAKRHKPWLLSTSLTISTSLAFIIRYLLSLDNFHRLIIFITIWLLSQVWISFHHQIRFSFKIMFYHRITLYYYITFYCSNSRQLNCEAVYLIM